MKPQCTKVISTEEPTFLFPVALILFHTQAKETLFTVLAILLAVLQMSHL